MPLSTFLILDEPPSAALERTPKRRDRNPLGAYSNRLRPWGPHWGTCPAQDGMSASPLKAESRALSAIVVAEVAGSLATDRPRRSRQTGRPLRGVAEQMTTKYRVAAGLI